MRTRRGSPLLLLLLAAPTLSHALELYSQDKSSAPDLRKREADPEPLENSGSNKVVAEPAPAAQESAALKRWRGKENAPVDGFDGKPHTGPFVVNTPDDDVKDGSVTTTAAKARPTNLDKWTQAGSGEWKIDEIPEKNDGVMNDDKRAGPKKGTDGTAGGISEKEKERRLKGYAENKPQEPKEAPEWLQEGEAKGGEKVKAGKDGERSGTRVVDQTTREDNKFGKGGYGIDLPENLPEKPHKLPHPEPRTGGAPPSSGGANVDGPPVAGGAAAPDPWLKDTMPYTESKKPKSVTKKQPDPLPPKSIDATFAEVDSWHEWFHSFVLSLTMILFSEIGDKTFLVAALMAMRHRRLLVFSAAFSALIVMTVLSAVLGHAFPTILPKKLTTFAAALLFLVFGAKSLKEGLEMDRNTGVGDEMKEVEAELEEKEHTMARDISRRRSSLSPYALESGRGRQDSFKLPKAEPSPPSSRSPSPGRNGGSSGKGMAGLVNLCSLVFSPAWVQTFIMTFLGEWGDRSQIATIAMAAGQDYWWVTLGAITGHACCTGLAVIGGRALAGRVSMRVVTIGGAVAFLAFGVIYLFECLTESSS